MQIRCRDSDLFAWFQRPAIIIALTARMLLAAGLFIALFLKLYMFLLTDLRCEAEIGSLGNAIRCNSALEMIAGTLILVAGLGVAAALFSRSGLDLIETVTMALCAVAIAFLADVAYDTATWQTAAVILSLFAAIAGLTFLARALQSDMFGRVAAGSTTVDTPAEASSRAATPAKPFDP